MDLATGGFAQNLFLGTQISSFLSLLLRTLSSIQISSFQISRYPDIFILILAASNTLPNIRINMKRGNNLLGWSFGQTPPIRRIDIKFPVASKSGTTFLLNTVSHCRKQNKFMKMNLFNIVLFTHLWSERYDMKVVCSLVFVKIRVPCVGNAWYTTLFWRVLVS